MAARMELLDKHMTRNGAFAFGELVQRGKAVAGQIGSFSPLAASLLIRMPLCLLKVLPLR